MRRLEITLNHYHQTRRRISVLCFVDRILWQLICWRECWSLMLIKELQPNKRSHISKSNWLMLNNLSKSTDFGLLCEYCRYLEKYADPNDEPISPLYDQSFEDMDLPVEKWKGNIGRPFLFVIRY